MKEIEILGTVYQLWVDDHGMDQQNADGVCRCYAKKIQVRPPEKMLCQDDDETLVVWLAKMVPRLVELFEEEGCLC